MLSCPPVNRLAHPLFSDQANMLKAGDSSFLRQAIDACRPQSLCFTDLVWVHTDHVLHPTIA